MNSQPTAFIVDDDEAVLKGLSLLLDSVGIEAVTFSSAAAFLDTYDADHPGCLLLDVRMPGMSGLEMQKKLSKKRVSLPVIMISGHGDVPMAVEALKGGAFDFIEKPFSEQKLLDSIQEAFRVDTETRKRRLSLDVIARRLEKLTRRERQVMDLVVQGKPNKEIARKLDLSKKTVEFHRANIMKKMKAGSLAQLVRFALETELH